MLVLDRDGVINHDPGDYTKNLRVPILPTVMEALTLAKSRFEVVLITNQGGLAKGCTPTTTSPTSTPTSHVCEENGTPILDIFYSPHHPPRESRSAGSQEA